MKINPRSVRRLVPYVAIPAALLSIPLDALDSVPSVCLFKNILGRECPGCGMTRAFLHAMHFRFIDAYSYNRLIVIVLPLSIYLFLRSLVTKMPFVKNGRNSRVARSSGDTSSI